MKRKRKYKSKENEFQTDLDSKQRNIAQSIQKQIPAMIEAEQVLQTRRRQQKEHQFQQFSNVELQQKRKMLTEDKLDKLQEAYQTMEHSCKEFAQMFEDTVVQDEEGQLPSIKEIACGSPSKLSSVNSAAGLERPMLTRASSKQGE